MATRWACVCSMSASLAPRAAPRPALPARLWTPARRWRLRRQQLELKLEQQQQCLSPRTTCFYPDRGPLSAPLHTAPALLESRSALRRAAGHKVPGARTREGLPEPDGAPPTSDPLGSHLGVGGGGTGMPRPVANQQLQGRGRDCEWRGGVGCVCVCWGWW